MVYLWKCGIKDDIKEGLEWFGIDYWKSHHIWYITYKSLLRLMNKNGFAIEGTYWQPQCKDMICYVSTRKQ